MGFIKSIIGLAIVLTLHILFSYLATKYTFLQSWTWITLGLMIAVVAFVLLQMVFALIGQIRGVAPRKEKKRAPDDYDW